MRRVRAAIEEEKAVAGMSEELRAWLNELRSRGIGSETAALLIDKCEELTERHLADKHTAPWALGRIEELAEENQRLRRELSEIKDTDVLIRHLADANKQLSGAQKTLNQLREYIHELNNVGGLQIAPWAIQRMGELVKERDRYREALENLVAAARGVPNFVGDDLIMGALWAAIETAEEALAQSQEVQAGD